MAKKKVNKTQLTKDEVSAAPEATPKEIAATLKKYGITASYVSNVKGKMNAKPKKRRQKGSPSKSVVQTAKTTDPLDAAIKFVEQCGGLKNAKAANEKIERIKSHSPAARHNETHSDRCDHCWNGPPELLGRGRG